jgi:transcriptional coactivator HFI1/ADA1
MSLLGKVCTNGPGLVRTGEFKKKMEKESSNNHGVLGGGVYVVEAEERRKRKMLCLEDLKLALQLGDGYLGQTPLIAGGIWHQRCLDTEGIEDLYKNENKEDGMKGGEVWNVEFGNPDVGDPMDIDGEEAWLGGDADGLDGVLDDVLNLADL